MAVAKRPGRVTIAEVARAADVTIAALTVVLVFVVAQRRLVEGIALTGIKG